MNPWDKSVDFVYFDTFLYDRLPRLAAIAAILVVAALFASRAVRTIVPPETQALYGVWAGVLLAYVTRPVFDRIKSW